MTNLVVDQIIELWIPCVNLWFLCPIKVWVKCVQSVPRFLC